MYQVNILTSKEFEKVARSNPRYKHVDEDNLGFADPVENKAYVRHTAFPELNKYLIEHEFEHLLEAKGTDEDDMGIRHKKKKGFANILQKFYNPLNFGDPISKSVGLTDDSKGFAGTSIGAAPSQEQGVPQLTPQEVSQSYQNSFGSTGAQFGNIGGTPQVSQSASVQGPEIGGNLYDGGLNKQAQQQSIDPQLQERLNGFFSGRIPF